MVNPPGDGVIETFAPGTSCKSPVSPLTLVTRGVETKYPVTSMPTSTTESSATRRIAPSGPTRRTANAASGLLSNCRSLMYRLPSLADPQTAPGSPGLLMDTVMSTALASTATPQDPATARLTGSPGIRLISPSSVPPRAWLCEIETRHGEIETNSVGPGCANAQRLKASAHTTSKARLPTQLVTCKTLWARP
jgi:hypothetical protein